MSSNTEYQAIHLLEKVVNQPDVQRIIRKQIEVYVSTFKLGQNSKDKSVDELYAIGAESIGSAGLAYYYPQSALFTVTAVAENFQSWRNRANNYVPEANPADVKKLSQVSQEGQQLLNWGALRAFDKEILKASVPFFNKNEYSPNNSLNRNGMPLYGGAMADSQHQKLLREFTFHDSRTITSTVNVYTDSNNPHAIGNVVQDKFRSVVMKPLKTPLGFGESMSEQATVGMPR